MTKLRPFAALSGLVNRFTFAFGSGVIFLFLVIMPSAYAEDGVPTPSVTEIVTNGGDDVSYQIPLTVSVVYDGVTYENVYATTNSVITFGNPDGTYWTYPSTPSISIESRDWWALPTYNPNMHFIISTSEGGFQVDGAYLPYGTMTGDITSIVITAQIQTNGTVSYTYSVDGPLYGGERTGARLTNGTVVPLEQANIVQVEEPVELAPEPVPPTPEPTPTPTPTPEPTPTPTPTPEPTPTPTPTPEPQPVLPIHREPIDISVPDLSITAPDTEEPSQTTDPSQEGTDSTETDGTDVTDSETDTSTDQEQETPNQEQENQSNESQTPPVDETPTVSDVVDDAMADGVLTDAEKTAVVDALLESSNGEALTTEAIAEAGLEYSDLPPGTPVEVRKDENGNEVIITAEVAAALQILESPSELFGAIFSDPGQVLLALGSIGADMSPQEREEATKMVVATVVAAGAAMNAAAVAASTTTGGTGGGTTPKGGGTGGGPAAGSDKPKRTFRRRIK